MKKVIIFTCIGGHNSISQALKDCLAGAYEPIVLNFFLDIVFWFDPIRWLTLGFFNAEDYYSFCMRNRLHRFLNKTHESGLKGLNLGRYFIKARLKKIVKKQQPAVIISVIPWFNDYLVAIAKELNIPFLLMPTDLEVSHFFKNIKKIGYEKSYFLPPFDDQVVRENALRLGFLHSHILVSGVALRQDFFTPHNQHAIRQQFSIPQSKPVVLLLMGSQGSKSMIDYAHSLSLIQQVPFHLIMVLGANSKQRKSLEKIVFDPLVTCTVLDFTPFIPQLMAISTLLITKSGGISVSEAIYMNLPTLLDATAEVLFWEERNQEFMKYNRFGTAVHCLHELPDVIKAFLTNRADMLEVYKKNMQLYEKKNGAESVKKLLHKILS